MSSFARSLVGGAIVMGAGFLVYRCLLDDRARESVESMVTSVYDAGRSLVERVGSASGNGRPESEVIDRNRALVERQWESLGY